jgi:hypothetical protein
MTPADRCNGGSPAAEGGRRSLDKRTQLFRPSRWRSTIYPDAGEAVVSAITAPREGPPKPSILTDEERATANHARANRRAKVESRRYMVANKLRYQWVLTFAEGLPGDAEGRAEAMTRTARFAVQLRDQFGRMAYWYSPEIHPGGHGWHVNLYVPRRLPHHIVQPMWGFGIVNVKDKVKDSRVRAHNLSHVEAVRLAAIYACKYATKDWSEQVLAGGAHRYEIAQGCRPTKLVVPTETLSEAVGAAIEAFDGEKPHHEWSSSDSPTWSGPPVRCMHWRRAAGATDA